LVARAFGADKIIISTKDKKIEENVREVCEKFGGSFQIEVGINPKKVIRDFKGTIVHLTMYGEDLNESISKIDKDKDLLIIVGSEKVPAYIYKEADFNVSIGNQPHSEVAALAIFLDRYGEGSWLKKKFHGKMEIIPSPRGKRVKRVVSSERCIEILAQSGCSDIIIDHCKAVRDLAIRIAKKANADIKLVEIGALLHDIGRSRTHGIDHGVEGSKIAKEIGLPTEIIRIIERHLGAGISKEEAIRLGLPARNYMPETLEEKIVAHADNLIDGCDRCQIQEQVEKAINRGQKELAERLLSLHRELSEICGINLNEI
jgi:tRNA (cytidine56-2'-O)-methyltransferase